MGINIRLCYHSIVIIDNKILEFQHYKMFIVLKLEILTFFMYLCTRDVLVEKLLFMTSSEHEIMKVVFYHSLWRHSSSLVEAQI